MHRMAGVFRLVVPAAVSAVVRRRGFLAVRGGRRVLLFVPAAVRVFGGLAGWR
jgi:hypothetical protein